MSFKKRSTKKLKGLVAGTFLGLTSLFVPRAYADPISASTNVSGATGPTIEILNVEDPLASALFDRGVSPGVTYPVVLTGDASLERDVANPLTAPSAVSGQTAAATAETEYSTGLTAASNAVSEAANSATQATVNYNAQVTASTPSESTSIKNKKVNLKSLEQQILAADDVSKNNKNYVISYPLGEDLIAIAKEGKLSYFVNIRDCNGKNLRYAGKVTGDHYNVSVPESCFEGGKVRVFSGVTGKLGDGSKEKPLASFFADHTLLRKIVKEGPQSAVKNKGKVKKGKGKKRNNNAQESLVEASSWKVSVEGGANTNEGFVEMYIGKLFGEDNNWEGGVYGRGNFQFD
ncbi:MAG: hypothetical protein D6767_08295, partial [Candidatus Hydrogenedentota bacterium]